MPRPEDFEKDFDRFDPFAHRDPTNTDDLWRPSLGVCDVCGADTEHWGVTLCEECDKWLDEEI